MMVMACLHDGNGFRVLRFSDGAFVGLERR